MRPVHHIIIAAAALSMVGLPTVGYVGWRSMSGHSAANNRLEMTRDLISRYQMSGHDIAAAFWRAIALRDEKSVAGYGKAIAARRVLAAELSAVGRSLGYEAETQHFEQSLANVRHLIGPVHAKLEAGEFEAALQLSTATNTDSYRANIELREATAAFQTLIKERMAQQEAAALSQLNWAMSGALFFVFVLALIWAFAARQLQNVSSALMRAQEELKTQAANLETAVMARTQELAAAQANLSMQNELMRDMSDVARVGGWSLDLQSQAMNWTAQTFQMFEADDDFELSIKSTLKLYDAASLPIITSAYTKAMETGTPFDIEAQVSTVKGRKFWVRLNGRVASQEGAPRYMVGAVQDITQEHERRLALEQQSAALKAAQQELALQNAQLNQMSELANVGGWEIDLRTRAIIWSEQTKRIHEVPLTFEPSHADKTRFCTPETAERTAEAFALMLKTDSPFDLEIPIVTERGNPRMLRSIGRVIRENGVPMRAMGALQDITQEYVRRMELESRTEQLLIAQRELHSQYGLMNEMAELAKVGAWQTNPTTKLSEWSHQTRLIHEVDDAFEVHWDTLLTFYDEDTRALLLQSFDQAKVDGQRFALDFPMTTAKGRSIRARVVGRYDEKPGAPPRFIGAIQDISEEYEIRREIEEARLAAEAANHAKSAFLANMSHEIRTPLNGVIGIAGALAKTKLDERQNEMVDLIRSSGDTLERLLSDILDMSKIEAGKLELQTDRFDLGEAIETAAQVMRVRADDKGVDFEVRYGQGARGIFQGDALRLRQLVSNLASNAIKFTKQGTVCISVDVEDRGQAPSLLRISVADTGVGFDETVARKLFSRFEQADGSITKSFGGTGLGLSICKALCELMGGTITARSTPGEGSVFTVELPLERTMALDDYDARADASETARKADSLEAPANTPALRILLAEDHPTNQRVVALILEPFGVNLTIANDGREAVEAFATQHFDAVLMDMQMPVMDGLSATAAIRAHERETGRTRTPIAMLSANAMQDHIDQAMAVGCDIHIAKPVTPQALIGGIEFLLALGHAPQEDAETVAA